MEIAVDCPVYRFVSRPASGGDVRRAVVRSGPRNGFRVDLPGGLDAEAWRVGLIVGPSGSGKSTVARAMFAQSVYRPRQWPRDRAVVDGLGDRPIKEITGLFTAVGFSSCC